MSGNWWMEPPSVLTHNVQSLPKSMDFSLMNSVGLLPKSLWIEDACAYIYEWWGMGYVQIQYPLSAHETAPNALFSDFQQLSENFMPSSCRKRNISYRAGVSGVALSVCLKPNIPTSTGKGTETHVGFVKSLPGLFGPATFRLSSPRTHSPSWWTKPWAKELQEYSGADPSVCHCKAITQGASGDCGFVQMLASVC